MMHKSVRLLSLLAALLAPFATLAQEAFPLTGRVVDSLLQSVPTAVVATLAPDSEAMLQHAVTDDEGRFTLSASGRVRLFVSCLGFAPYVGEPFDVVRATTSGSCASKGRPSVSTTWWSWPRIPTQRCVSSRGAWSIRPATAPRWRAVRRSTR